MPGGDRTGPMGDGPMTGRGLGICSGYAHGGFAMRRRAFGRGLGRGFGWRRFGSYDTERPSKEQEISMLEEEAKDIEQQQSSLQKTFEDIRKRIEELRQ